MKKIMYLRSGPYEPSEKEYNLQEVGMLSELCKRGYDCDLFYYGKLPKEKIINFEAGTRLKINWVKGIRILRSGVYPTLLSKSFLSEYDIIIGSEYSQIMTWLLSKRHHNVFCYNGPYYNLFKILPIEKIYDFLFTSSLNKNIKFFFCKSILSEEYLNKKGILSTKTIGVGQNLEKFSLTKNNEMKLDTTKTLEKFVDENSLLYVGSISERKNFPFLLKVAEQALEKNPSLKLVIIGKGKDKYIYSNLSKLPEDIQSKIKIIPFVQNDQLKYIYPKALALLLPSKKEIFGMVMLEAMSLGLPVISSDNGGSRTLINNNHNGIIASIKTTNEWIRAIDYLSNKEIRSQVSVAAKETITQFYSWEKVVDNMIIELVELEE